MTRRCSHCSTNGHNSRTCPNRGVKLFGVRLTDGLIRKSASMGNLTHFGGCGGGGGGSSTGLNGVVHDSPGDTPDHPAVGGAAADGYGSEDFVAGSSSSRERKKGVPWTEEEHRMFLLGLQKLGKGDWRGIARNYVITRTPTQVASHAQKYFIRQSNMSRRKRRSSLFDIVADESGDTPMVSRDFLAEDPQAEMQSNNPLPPTPVVDEECESMGSAASANSIDGEHSLPIPESSQYPHPLVYPAYVAPFFPMPYPCWPGYTAEPAKAETHEVLKPTAVHSKSPINVDELVGMSKLSLGESIGNAKPPSLSLKLVEGSSRQSAFHANPSSGSSGMNSSHSPIHAV
ncbi:Transcription factor DIVARICATA [Capsicum annuum]|uniref:transcription factor MYBS3 n=1 Tax=Capsicum annuum TaxID=4072 RepID=UPI001FB182EB|nr:transcription factor MYBS3 [Capsicum annuum]KAF3654647.1 Transcription factor DIVARICATA [Capsicum annuum]